MTKIIGLTGGIGSGKTTVAKYIASKGIPVYIADDEAKKIMKKKRIIAQIQSVFPTSILDDLRQLDRVKIAKIVFENPEKLKQLNEIVHPEVKKHFDKWLQLHKNAPFIVKEVAILFETGGEKYCDAVILITAPQEIRIQRAMQRDGIDEKSILNKIKNQMPEEEKMKKSTYIIHNIELKSTFQSMDEILKKLTIV